MNDPLSDRLDADRIRSLLCISADVYVHDVCDSTNNEAKRLSRAGQLGQNTLICAESQTAGRGRSGHTFYSPDSTGLYMTAVLSPKVKPADVIPLTTMAAVAVIETLQKYSDGEFAIKWVNDIYLMTPDGMRKVCGILTELETDAVTLEVKHVIIGIGINVTTADFPSDIAGIAASTGSLKADRNTLAAEIMSRLYEMSLGLSSDEQGVKTAYMATYRKYSAVLGKTVTYTYNGKEYTAKAAEIDDNAALITELDDGTRMSLNGGEISIKFDRNQ
nr:biotin--[acetyl-CoA-carboxylase] ligase [Clostridia bacterium]